MFQGRFRGVSNVFKERWKGVALRVSQGSSKGSSKKFKVCLEEDSRTFQGSFMVVKEDLGFFQRYFKIDGKVFKGSFKGVSREFQGYFKEVQRVFQGSF